MTREETKKLIEELRRKHAESDEELRKLRADIEKLQNLLDRPEKDSKRGKGKGREGK